MKCPTIGMEVFRFGLEDRKQNVISLEKAWNKMKYKRTIWVEKMKGPY